MDAVAVDWSGAADGGRRGTWLARVREGHLVELENGRGREEVVATLAAAVGCDATFVIGFDFAFSLPAWYCRSLGVERADVLWALAATEGESWLANCEPPFWGRPGRPRPALVEHWRVTERRVDPVGGVRPKSVFQVGGAGAVGTGSIRGMPHLATLDAAGASVWPFRVGGPTAVVEIYPRLFTGALRKSREEERRRLIEPFATAGPPELWARAVGSEDAFDAALSALGLWHCREQVARLEATDDPEGEIEGAIFLPEARRAADRVTSAHRPEKESHGGPFPPPRPPRPARSA